SAAGFFMRAEKRSPKPPVGQASALHHLVRVNPDLQHSKTPVTISISVDKASALHHLVRINPDLEHSETFIIISVGKAFSLAHPSQGKTLTHNTAT
uniref:hypothetical protein n=1 Tax=Pseudoalteromonas ruthenica TaxID=151081 RepID=UPI00241D3B14